MLLFFFVTFSSLQGHVSEVLVCVQGLIMSLMLLSVLFRVGASVKVLQFGSEVAGLC